jgi:HlyD family secretion protein
MDDSDAVAKLAATEATLRTAEANLHDVEQGGSQDEHISLTGDLSRAQLQQQQATKDLAALKKLEKKGAASASEVAAAEERLQAANNLVQAYQLRGTQRYSSTDKVRSRLRSPTLGLRSSPQSSYAGYNIRTPKAGTVYSIPISTYDFVPAGETSSLSPTLQ